MPGGGLLVSGTISAEQLVQVSAIIVSEPYWFSRAEGNIYIYIHMYMTLEDFSWDCEGVVHCMGII